MLEVSRMMCGLTIYHWPKSSAINVGCTVHTHVHMPRVRNTINCEYQGARMYESCVYALTSEEDIQVADQHFVHQPAIHMMNFKK